MTTLLQASRLPWTGLSESERAEIMAWMREQGIDPEQTRELEIVAEGALRVVLYKVNAEGYRYLACPVHGDPAPDGCDFTCEVFAAQREVTVPFTSLPPRCWPGIAWG